MTEHLVILMYDFLDLMDLQGILKKIFKTVALSQHSYYSYIKQEPDLLTN